MDVDRIVHVLTRLAIAFALSVPIAWDRERTTRIMGLRTFPLVALASCGYILIVTGLEETGAEANARVLQGLMTGIGFIGAGAILKTSSGVLGTATAASVWSTGAVGAAAGFGEYPVAIVIAVASFLTLRLLTPLGRDVRGDEIDEVEGVGAEDS